MAKLSDYLLSTKPAKLPLLNAEGEDTGDYLEVISADAAKVARVKTAWQSARLAIEREFKATEDRSVDDKILPEDVDRRSEIINFELKEVNAEFAAHLVCGWSFGELDADQLSELLLEGDIAVAVIALANDTERLKKN